MISICKLVLFVASAASLASASVVGATGDMPSPPFQKYHDTASAPLFDAVNSHRDLATRSDDQHLNKRSGYLYCGNFATADFHNAHSLVSATSGSETQHTAAAHGCNRVGCMNTSGLYICNDNDYSLTMTGNDVTPHADNILNYCCIHNKNGNLDLQVQSGGQQFTNVLGGNWNTIVAYANCNHPVNTPPSDYNGGTVNGIGCLSAVMYLG